MRLKSGKREALSGNQQQYDDNSQIDDANANVENAKRPRRNLIKNSLPIRLWQNKMSLETFTARRIVDKQPCGLANEGNYCYVNCFLQIWFNNFEFRQCVYDWHPAEGFTMEIGKKFDVQAVMNCLQRLFCIMQSTPYDYASSNEFIQVLQLNDEQNDVLEFHQIFFDRLEQNLLDHPNGKAIANSIRKLFQGTMKQTISCTSCGYINETKSEYRSLQIGIEGFDKMSEALNAFFAPELLTDHVCDSCKERGKTIKQNYYIKFPNVLIIQLKRLILDAKDRIKKVKTCLGCPKSIQPKWLHSESNDRNIYDVCAVIIHDGQRSDSGYFYSIIQCPFSSQWFKYKDKTVCKTTAPIDEYEHKSNYHSQRHYMNECYALIYKKRTSQSRPVSVVNLPRNFEAIRMELEAHYAMLFGTGNIEESAAQSAAGLKLAAFKEEMFRAVNLNCKSRESEWEKEKHSISKNLDNERKKRREAEEENQVLKTRIAHLSAEARCERRAFDDEYVLSFQTRIKELEEQNLALQNKLSESSASLQVKSELDDELETCQSNLNQNHINMTAPEIEFLEIVTPEKANERGVDQIKNEPISTDEEPPVEKRPRLERSTSRCTSDALMTFTINEREERLTEIHAIVSKHNDEIKRLFEKMDPQKIRLFAEYEEKRTEFANNQNNLELFESIIEKAECLKFLVDALDFLEHALSEMKPNKGQRNYFDWMEAQRCKILSENEIKLDTSGISKVEMARFFQNLQQRIRNTIFSQLREDKKEMLEKRGAKIAAPNYRSKKFQVK